MLQMSAGSSTGLSAPFQSLAIKDRKSIHCTSESCLFYAQTKHSAHLKPGTRVTAVRQTEMIRHGTKTMQGFGIAVFFEDGQQFGIGPETKGNSGKVTCPGTVDQKTFVPWLNELAKKGELIVDRLGIQLPNSSRKFSVMHFRNGVSVYAITKDGAEGRIARLSK